MGGVTVSRSQDPAAWRRTGTVPEALGLSRQLLALLLILLALTLPPAPAAALSLPWRSQPAASRTPPTTSASLPLQELSPPEPVRQLQTALAGRQPVVEILSPRDDSLLDGSPWTLKLRVHDWPLVDGGALGPGPHLVVQLDQDPPQIWTATQGTLPPLSPGSHRLTVYAAFPWGEALRNPGAWQQIRLHRTAANPLALPARGSPQLLAVSPPAQAGAEPLLLDWLLLDAPLQNLRGADSPWRLRVSINGDSFLLDQQTPLWLQGWRTGVNAVRLELLDSRGDPLNPPFNSLVQEVDRDGSRAAPRWLGARLTAEELAVLLGRAPAPAPAPVPLPPAVGDRSEPEAAPRQSAAPEAALRADPSKAAPPRASTPPLPPEAAAGASPSSSETATAPATAARAPGASGAAPAIPTAAAPPAAPQAMGPAPPLTEAADGQPTAAASDASTMAGSAAGEASPSARPSEPATPPAPAAGAADSGRGEPGSSTASGGWNGSPGEAAKPSAATATTATASESGGDDRLPAGPAPAADEIASSGMPQRSDAAKPAPSALPDGSSAARSSGEASPTSFGATSDRIRPASTLQGRARDLVAADGTLKRPEPSGPLQRLRSMLAR